MWSLINQTPFAAERAWTRDRTGAEVWLVAVKGSFLVRTDGSPELASKQESVRLSPIFRGKPGRSSLQYDSDLILTKPTTDILLHGNAYAPNSRPVRVVDATLRVDSIRKTLRVFGDRRWKSGWFGPQLSDPEPFLKMPLIYEHAYGGAHSEPPLRDARNPIGRGFVKSKADLVGQLAPNIEYPERQGRPAGFGPLCSDWEPRRELAGTYDSAWQEKRKPLLPADFSDRFFQVSPVDQQASGYLVGGEEVELINLTPEGIMRFRLPRLRLGFETRLGRQRVYHRARLHTVIFEPDLRRVLLVWHTALPCHHDVFRLTHTRIYLKRQIRSLPLEIPLRLSASRSVPWEDE
jgi:hypothetical protein